MGSRESSPAFSLNVDGVKGVCPAGEKYAQENIAEEKIPVLSCEGPCIRGEIASSYKFGTISDEELTGLRRTLMSN